MKTGLITGITGQDGSYLAELLLAQGYRVVGAVRDVRRASKILSILQIEGIELVKWDMLNQREMGKVLSRYRPDEVYNFAAYSSGEGMFDDSVGIGQINGLAVARILEAIRQVNKNIRFCQASSSEMFGDIMEVPQSEKTEFHPRSPYGAAKLYAHSLIQIYRRYYGLFACSAILFNHESPRRGFNFVTRKITSGAAKIKLGQASELFLGSLEACRDWGFAGDYVRAMWLMLGQLAAEDYVISTGETHSVRELCEIAFGHLGLNYGDCVRLDPAAYRLDESLQLVGNSEKARKKLGWVPEVKFREMITMMVDADLRILKAEPD